MRSEMNQRRTFLPGEAVRDSQSYFLSLLLQNQYQPALKALLWGGWGSGKGENSDFDLRKSEVEGKDKEVR